MLGLKLIHVSKKGPWDQVNTRGYLTSIGIPILKIKTVLRSCYLYNGILKPGHRYAHGLNEGHIEDLNIETAHGSYRVFRLC